MCNAYVDVNGFQIPVLSLTCLSLVVPSSTLHDFQCVITVDKCIGKYFHVEKDAR